MDVTDLFFFRGSTTDSVGAIRMSVEVGAFHLSVIISFVLTISMICVCVGIPLQRLLEEFEVHLSGTFKA